MALLFLNRFAEFLAGPATIFGLAQHVSLLIMRKSGNDCVS
jgi:hypothetical protein